MVPPPPKFRGDSDDWLDDEAPRSGIRAKSGKKAGFIPLSRTNATVATVFPHQVSVRMDGKSELKLCNFRYSNFPLETESGRLRAPLAVGDRVQVEGDVVTGLCARENRLVRRAPDKEGTEHLIASNLDVVAIVTSAHDPEFSAGLVDRFLVAASAQGITPVVCLNKFDLVADSEGRPWTVYAEVGYEVFEVSAKRGDHVGDLLERLRGCRTAFCGHSGVGKTSLLSRLLGREVGKTSEISSATGKGRHTTTSAQLLDAGSDNLWIDTPGVREFGLVGVAPESLQLYFPEIRKAAGSCEQTGCLHRDEDGCAARELSRYSSYRRILESLVLGEG